MWPRKSVQQVYTYIHTYIHTHTHTHTHTQTGKQEASIMTTDDLYSFEITK